jgi:peptidoglycan/xylan/chitin deacetylase (PgdA/CDA1 family)
MPDLYHALGFHMHQPPGNLELLWREQQWEARQIMLCYQRPLKYAQRFRNQGRFHVDFSGILLEQLLDPVVNVMYREVVDIEAMLAGYREATNIELLSTGYYHPIFPLIPEHDWPDQLHRSIELMERLFGRRPRGFWPPEMAFSMEMIPVLAKAGFEYVVVDHVHLLPEEETTAEDAATHPCLVHHMGAEIVVVPRHRDLSNAQESGLAPEWLADQIARRAASLHGPALFTTWSDGENGGWFRQTAEEAGFWGHFYAPYMEGVKAGHYPLTPILISDYLADYPPEHAAEVRTGAWNVGTSGGFDFSQWAGSPAQKAVLAQVWRSSERCRHLQRKLASLGDGPPEEARRLLQSAHDSILRAETSCYFFWGDSWTPKAREHLNLAERDLQRARELLGPGAWSPAETLSKTA